LHRDKILEPNSTTLSLNSCTYLFYIVSLQRSLDSNGMLRATNLQICSARKSTIRVTCTSLFTILLSTFSSKIDLILKIIDFEFDFWNPQNLTFLTILRLFEFKRDANPSEKLFSIGGGEKEKCLIFKSL